MFDDNCKFFLKRNTNKSSRQIRNVSSHSSSSDYSDDEESSVIHAEQKKRKPNPMIQSTCSFKKSKNRKKNLNNPDDDNDDDDDVIHVSYASTKSSQREGPADMGATMKLETETEHDKDAQSIFERSQKIQKEIADNNDEIYRGANNYKQYKQKNDTPLANASSGHVRVGPMRAPDNIRSTVRWDYQPDICKDYKETGFCGFGDSCKFLHDRSDYKAGWQLEMEESKKNHAHNNDDDNDDDPDKYKIDDDDDLPFACFICRNRFVDPVVTKCKHYFCQKCALDYYKKSTKCFVCSAQTSGVFNIAKDLEKRMKLSNQKNLDKDLDYDEKEHHQHQDISPNDEDSNDDDE